MTLSTAYFDGNAIQPEEAPNHYAAWTLDELLVLRDYWRLVDLHDIAVHLGRSESACLSMYYTQRARPESEQFTPAERDKAAWRGMAAEHRAQDRRAAGPVAHDEDDDAWWTPGYYLQGA